VGFMVYVSMTYTSLIPYLKGIYLTLNSWRPDRDKEGWKDPKFNPEVNSRKHKKEKVPKWVEVVPTLKHDLQALLELTQHAHPPDVPIRSKHKRPMYLVGDASGAGFVGKKEQMKCMLILETGQRMSLRERLQIFVKQVI
jgi:hypothetical protein